MLNHRLSSFPARRSSRGGFTLVELLVVIGIIAILAGVALGPITRGLETAKESAGMQTARTIALSEFQYQSDNGTYPGGAKSQDIVVDLVQGGYITDPSIFASNKSLAYSGTVSGLSGMKASAICWDFMTSSTAATAPATGNVGLSTSDPDGMPLVYTTGQGTITPPTQGPSNTALKMNANNTNPFGNNGMAVCYKSNSAVFLKAISTDGTTYDINTSSANYLFNASFTCTPGNYTSIQPQ